MSPPNPPVPSKQCIAKRRSLFERCVRWVTYCSKVGINFSFRNGHLMYLVLQAMVWLAATTDGIATILAYIEMSGTPTPLSPTWQGHVSSIQCPPNSSHPENAGSFNTPSYAIPAIVCPLLTPSPLFFLGVMSVACGALLRLWCFRALGQFFTFELSIHPSHSLVTTGPYSFVRHPSYTGIYLTLLGGTLVGLAPGTWLYERWIYFPVLSQDVKHLGMWIMSFGSTYSTPIARPSLPSIGMVTPASLLVYTLITFWLVKVWYALRSTNRRLQIEDVELHKVFGDVWDEYAERVRWRLLPGIF